MSLSKYSSTTKTTNFARLARLILGPCTDILREILKKEILPKDLSKNVKKWTIDLARKGLRNPLNKQQADLIFPLPTKKYGSNYSDFDIGLLYLLLRNISKITPHAKGWGEVPHFLDRSESANIERIRLIRNNYYGHINDFSISGSLFEQEWQNIHDIVVELELIIWTATSYQNAVTEIKTCSMDPEKEMEYIKKLAAIDELSDKIESLSEEIRNLKGPIPGNVKELHEQLYIIKWKEEDKVFHEIHSYPSILEKVRDKQYVVFVGGPGSGKSVMARHIALLLQKEQYEVVPIKDIKQIEEYCDLQNRQVFVLDDVVGVFGVQESKINLLSDFEHLVLKPPMPDSKILMTCRETVFRKAKYISAIFAEESNVIMLHSDENKLNEKDKICLMEAYKIDSTFLSTNDLELVSKMFPLLCKLFSTDKFLSYGSLFFKCPIPCVLEELDNMYKQNNIHYGSLVLCMMNGNKLSEEILENTGQDLFSKRFVEMKRNICKKLKISTPTDNFKFIDALCEMKGTYTKLNEGDYTFIHVYMIEILAHHFGLIFPELIIKYMNCCYVSNYVKPKKCDIKTNDRKKQKIEIKEICEIKVCVNESDTSSIPVDLCVYFDEEHYQLFAERLYSDIEDMHLYDVFMNTTLKHTKVCEAFIDVLKCKGYKSIKKLFLSVKNDQLENIILKRKDAEQKIWQARNNEFTRQKLLLGLRDISEKLKFNIRVISWVVYYGHHNILHYIINQTEQNKETQFELFQRLESSCPGSDFSATNSDLSVSNVMQQGADTSYIHGLTSDSNSSEINFEGNWNSSDEFAESTRLIVLSCYSGDVETVKVLLNHVNKNALNRTSRYQGYIFDYWRQDTPLTSACQGGNEIIVRELIKIGSDVNFKRDSYHPFPEPSKFKSDRLDLVHQYLNIAGVDVNSVLTPLVVACKTGHSKVVKELLQAGADINAYSVGESPLIAACRGGHVSIVHQLLQSGAEVNPKGEGYIPFQTPLIAASYHGHLDVVKKLLEAEADVNLHGIYYSSLSAACENGHLHVANELLKRGADINPQSIFYMHMAPAAKCRRKARLNRMMLKRSRCCCYKCNIPGIYKRRRDSLLFVTDLIRRREDEQKQYFYCISLIILSGELQKLHFILNPDTIYAPLTIACRNGHVDLVKNLLKAGADANLQDQNGTPLIAACKGGHLDVVMELIEHGAEINLQSLWKYETPLIAASIGNHSNVVSELLKAGADAYQINMCQKIHLS